ncbi:MAG: hypothetical protein ACJ74T_14600 [Pyrinomonadaceae bacterium]
MARLKRSSAVLETARRRLAGLKSITPKVDFGPALDVDQYEEEINHLSASIDKYNEMLALLDQMLNGVEAEEAQVNDKTKRMLAATGAQYGTNSSQYEQVGGTRPDDRKYPAKKKPGGGGSPAT